MPATNNMTEGSNARTASEIQPDPGSLDDRSSLKRVYSLLNEAHYYGTRPTKTDLDKAKKTLDDAAQLIALALDLGAYRQLEDKATRR